MSDSDATRNTTKAVTRAPDRVSPNANRQEHRHRAATRPMVIAFGRFTPGRVLAVTLPMRSAPSVPDDRDRDVVPDAQSCGQSVNVMSPSISGASRCDRPIQVSLCDVEALDEHLEGLADERLGPAFHRCLRRDSDPFGPLACHSAGSDRRGRGTGCLPRASR